MKSIDGGFTWKTSVGFIFCLEEALNGNQNYWICDMSTSRYLIEILLHNYKAQQTKVVSVFLFTLITHELWEHLVELFTFYFIFFIILVFTFYILVEVFTVSCSNLFLF